MYYQISIDYFIEAYKMQDSTERSEDYKLERLQQLAEELYDEQGFQF